MTSFTIEVKDEEVRAKLKALSDRSANMSAVLQTIGAGILERTQRRFDTSSGPDGVKWKANTAATRKAKGGKPPLVDKGYLRQHIRHNVVANLLTVSTGPQTNQYAAIHQFGGTIDRAASNIKVRHRTDAKGDLLRSAIMNGKGLIFAKKSHKRALERQFNVAAHKITIPARPYLPIHQDGTLYPIEQAEILKAINAYLTEGL